MRKSKVPTSYAYTLFTERTPKFSASLAASREGNVTFTSPLATIFAVPFLRSLDERRRGFVTFRKYSLKITNMTKSFKSILMKNCRYLIGNNFAKFEDIT